MPRPLGSIDPKCRYDHQKDESRYKNPEMRDPTQQDSTRNCIRYCRARPCQGSPFGLETRVTVGQRVRHQISIKIARTQAQRAAKERSGTIAGIGRGRPCRIARSTRSHLTAAPAEINNPIATIKTEVKVRI